MIRLKDLHHLPFKVCNIFICELCTVLRYFLEHIRSCRMKDTSSSDHTWKENHVMLSPTCFFRIIGFHYRAWWEPSFSLVCRGWAPLPSPALSRERQPVESPTESLVHDLRPAAGGHFCLDELYQAGPSFAKCCCPLNRGIDHRSLLMVQ